MRGSSVPMWLAVLPSIALLLVAGLFLHSIKPIYYDVEDCGNLHSRAIGAKIKNREYYYDVIKPERNKGRYRLEFIK